MGGDGSEGAVSAILQSRIGTLRTYYYNDNGEKVVVDDSAGTINYDTGKVTLTSLYATGVQSNDFYPDLTLTINVPVDREIITPLRNRIMDIDTQDPLSVQISIVAE